MCERTQINDNFQRIPPSPRGRQTIGGCKAADQWGQGKAARAESRAPDARSRAVGAAICLRRLERAWQGQMAATGWWSREPLHFISTIISLGLAHKTFAPERLFISLISTSTEYFSPSLSNTSTWHVPVFSKSIVTKSMLQFSSLAAASVLFSIFDAVQAEPPTSTEQA